MKIGSKIENPNVENKIGNPTTFISSLPIDFEREKMKVKKNDLDRSFF